MSHSPRWTVEQYKAHQLKESAKPNKYRNKITIANGIKFHSKKEAGRYLELKMMERANLIKGLELQKRYDIMLNGEKLCSYIADFFYYKNELNFPGTWKPVVEDVKGMKRGAAYQMFKLKKALMKIIYNIEVLET